ncbi:glycoside hydrolase family 99-like domain-containing protein [Candidatus Woesearchaeota archaeon]|nr:glycoside hydrolase family 99-like domain-containing protein [Candidatus Woesearchaeota archaeon]
MNKRLGLAGIVLAAATGIMGITGCGSAMSESPTTPTRIEPSPWPTPNPTEKRATIYVLNHVWYYSGADRCPWSGDPREIWGPWVWRHKIDDPCQIIPGTTWLREISSNAYPINGAYDSSNPDILRWQIRQAKYAGIDGFIIPLYTWAPHLERLREMFFGSETRIGMLQMAHEEDFQLGIDVWNSDGTTDELWKEEIGRHIDSILASPYRDAYIHIDGRPLIWIMYPKYMSGIERIELLDGTRNHPRKANYILRNAKIEDIISLNEHLLNSRAQFETDYNYPMLNGWHERGEFVGELAQTKTYSALLMHRIAHAYVGYDERFGRLADPAGFQGRYGKRDGVEFMTTFLEKAALHEAEFILLESWNEWGEGSMIEPGINTSAYRQMEQSTNDRDKPETDLYQNAQGADDPFMYLKAIYQFQYGSMEGYQPGPPIPCSAIDPLMAEYHRTMLPSNMRCIPDEEGK